VSPGLRILGLANEPLLDFRSSRTRNAGLFVALDRRFDVVGVVRPRPSRGERWRMLARHVHPRRETWRLRAGMNAAWFRRRTELAEAELARREGEYDLLLELQTLFAPGERFRERRYVVYTDNILPLTRRWYPQWAPLREREARRLAELEAEVCCRAEVVFAMSDFLREALIEDYGCERERVVRVGGGANSVATSLEGRRWDARVALFAGYDFRRKGGDTLLRAWAAVRRRLPGAELWVAGPPPRRLGPASVRWLGPVPGRARLEELYRQASVFVLPSLFEPWGHVFLEAMGNGLPCIATSRCAMPEIVEDGLTGLVVPAGAAGPLEEALVALLVDPMRAEEMGRLAYERVLAGGTWDHVVARMAPHVERAVTG
jgi:glycosyltransferase involved in cell wall biosynthesis